MNEWKITQHTNNMNCGDRFDGTCANPENSGPDFRCTIETCPARIDESPITPEWLESVGAEKAQLALSIAYHIWTPDNILISTEFIDGVASVVIDRKFTHTPERWPHIQNRHQFGKLYRLLSGRGLEQ